LNQQDGPEIVGSEDREYRRQERRISRQPGQRGHYDAGIRNSEDAVLKPVFRNIGVETGVVDHSRKPEDENEAYCDSGEGYY
jgi:hypothetical protein